SLLDTLRRVQRRIGDDLISGRRSCPGECATLKHAIEHVRETNIHGPAKSSRVRLEYVGRTKLQRLAPQQNQKASHVHLNQIRIVTKCLRIEHDKPAWLLSHNVDVGFLKIETARWLKRRIECDDTTKRLIRRCDPRAAIQRAIRKQTGDRAAWRHAR